MVDSRTDNRPPRALVGATIVFVDNDIALQSSLKRIFQRGAIALHTFGKSADALQFIKSQPTDIVIAAMRMPEMTGLELLNHVSALRPDAIRIITSGPEDKPVLIHVLAKGLVHNYVLKPWENPELLGIVRKGLELQREILEKQLRDIVNSSDALPSPPKFHERLRVLLGKETSSLHKIAAEIEKDGVLVAQLLRVANSVYYGARSSIINVRDAVVFIGTEHIASLIMALEAFHNVGGDGNERSARTIDQLWHQALRRATIARLIGKGWAGFHNADLAYVSSLLQDLGYVVRISYEPDKYFDFLAYCKTEGIAMHEAESKFFKISHEDVGATLLKFWNLPPEIVTAISQHHRCTNNDILTKTLQIADILECSDATVPHDPEIDPLILECATKLQFKRPRGLFFQNANEPAPPAAV